MTSEVNPQVSERLGRRLKRLQQAIALQEPDRVPFNFRSTFWHAKYAGITFEEAMYDVGKNIGALKQAIELLDPDSLFAAVFAFGPAMEGIDYRPLKWPGHGTDPNTTYQYIDEKFMDPEEYDEYLLDPTRFYFAKYLPRIAGGFECLSAFPQFTTVNEWIQIAPMMRAFANKELQEGIENLFRVGEQVDAMMREGEHFYDEMAAQGYPSLIGGFCKAPYDWFVDTMRGSKGGTLDMLRNKDRLLESMVRARDLQLQNIVDDAKASRTPGVFLPMHWGIDGFMSPDQFNTFYWPELKKVLTYLIDNELTPFVLWEGNCETRLEAIGDLPPGKAVYMFEMTDLIKAKDVLGDTVCILGNVPASLLIGGTPGDVDDYCCKLIRDVGKGGGFILDGAIGIPDEARTENVIAMARSVRKYSA